MLRNDASRFLDKWQPYHRRGQQKYFTLSEWLRILECTALGGVARGGVGSHVGHFDVLLDYLAQEKSARHGCTLATTHTTLLQFTRNLTARILDEVYSYRVAAAKQVHLERTFQAIKYSLPAITKPISSKRYMYKPTLQNAFPSHLNNYTPHPPSSSHQSLAPPSPHSS